MYNGIGLTTPRGSGTNGYVQRNVAFIKRDKDRVDYKSEADLKRGDTVMFKEPNREILEHERKRKIEVKCLEMEELMEEQGYPPEEIERKVANFRKFLAKESEAATAEGGTVATDADTGRLVAKGTHAEQSARQQQAETVRSALNIDKEHVPGQSLMRRSEKPAPTAAEEEAVDKLPYLRSDSSSSSSESSSGSEKAKKRKRKRKKEKKAKKEKKDKKEKRKKKKEAKRRRKEKKESGEESGE